MMFLQKACHAKRVYAMEVHAKMISEGFNSLGIMCPSGDMNNVLLEKCYQECGADTSALEYIEAHGTATKVCFIQSQN